VAGAEKGGVARGEATAAAAAGEATVAVAGEAVAATAEEEVAVADAVKEVLLGNDFFVAVKSFKGNNITKPEFGVSLESPRRLWRLSGKEPR
jgi:hypothetical protein